MMRQGKEQLLIDKMEQKGLSQKEIAQILGKSESVVSRKINKVVKFTIKEKMILAEYFKMDTDEKLKFCTI